MISILLIQRWRKSEGHWDWMRSDWIKDVTELSGGQRTEGTARQAASEKPDILLLDEPTTYLDVQHIEWLEAVSVRL